MGHQTHKEKPISWKRKIKIFLITHINYDNLQYIYSFSSAPLSFLEMDETHPLWNEGSLRNDVHNSILHVFSRECLGLEVSPKLGRHKIKQRWGKSLRFGIKRRKKKKEEVLQSSPTMWLLAICLLLWTSFSTMVKTEIIFELSTCCGCCKDQLSQCRWKCFTNYPNRHAIKTILGDIITDYKF